MKSSQKVTTSPSLYKTQLSHGNYFINILCPALSHMKQGINLSKVELLNDTEHVKDNGLNSLLS